MAIVIRSERDFKLLQNSSGKIGPGDYIKDNSSSEIIQQNLAPFNSKSLRYFDFSENLNPDVGPGSYYRPKQRSFIRKSYNRNHSSLEKLNKKDLYNLALFKVVNTKKAIKLQEQKSLIIDKQNKSQVFNLNNNINNNSTIDIRLYSPQINYKLIPTTLTKNRINSIPSKDHCLGYDFDENGLPIIVDSSTINKKNNEENEKNNLNYKKKEKKINALDWSKMSRKDISDNEITTKDNTINNNSSKIFYNNTSRDLNANSNNSTNTSQYIKNRQISSKESSGNFINQNKINNKVFLNSNESNSSLTNNEVNSYKNISNSNIYKSFSNENNYKKINKIKGNLYKTTNKDIIKKEHKISVEDFVYNNLFKGDPGPGYYQEQSIFDKYILFSNKNRRFNFGSNERRDKNFNKPSSENLNLGPGYYFQESNTPKFKVRLYPLSRKEQTINIKKYEKNFLNENIGPGKYDIKSQFDKTQIYYSGPLEKRFFENNRMINPGPGEYLQLYDWEKNLEENQKIKPKFYIINRKNEENNQKKEEKGRHGYIVNNDNPGVGNYNPHIINSIKYNIISKDNKVSNLIAPFSSGQEKFLKKSASTSDMIGPGSFFPNINMRNYIFRKEDKKGNHLFKNDVIKKDNVRMLYNQMKLNLERQIGPGSYELHNFNEWHKKSFNSLYI